MSHKTLRRKLEQHYTVPDQCRDFGEPHPVQKPMSMSERVFLSVMIVVALVICIVCFVRAT